MLKNTTYNPDDIYPDHNHVVTQVIQSPRFKKCDHPTCNNLGNHVLIFTLPDGVDDPPTTVDYYCSPEHLTQGLQDQGGGILQIIKDEQVLMGVDDWYPLTITLPSCKITIIKKTLKHPCNL